MSAALFALALAAEQALPPNNPFSWLDSHDCAASSDGPVMPREALIAALLKTYPMRADASAFGGHGPTPAEQIATVACDEGICPAPLAPVKGLQNAALDMIDARSGGGFSLVWAGDGPEPQDPQGQVQAFYDLSRPGYRLRCESLPGPAPPPKPSLLRTLAIASSAEEASKPEFAKRDPAVISFRADRQADTEVGTVKAAVLGPALLTWGGAEGEAVSGRVGLYAAYNRVTNADRAKEVNNLDLGVRSLFVIDGPLPVPVGLNLYWQTDDRWKSSLLRAEATLRPPLEGLLPKGAGYGAEVLLSRGAGYRWGFEWDAHLALDYADVQDPGDKVALVGTKSYFRGGYDLTATLRYRRRAADPAWSLTADYKLRDDWSGERASADYLALKATYVPNLASHFTFGVEYGEGEDLSSLVRAEYVLFSLGYRQ